VISYHGGRGEEMHRQISTGANRLTPPEGKFQRIAQLMEKYQQEITELTKKLTPTTPLEVRDQREQETNAHIDSIAQEAKVVEEFYDKTAQMWTNMEEDEKIQQLDQKQEKITPDIQDLKQQQKAMAILERMRSAQDMKNLQAELKVAPTNKQARQAQLEPLQQEA
jgi:hypothetical protein